MPPRIKLLLARAPGVYTRAHRARTRARYAVGRIGDPDFAAFRQFRDRPGLFLDVGANIGQSAMSFRRMHPTAPILSIEANPALEGELRRVKRIVPGFDYRMCAASDEAGELTLHIPVYRGLTLTGEASMLAASADRPYWAGEQGVGDHDADLGLRTTTVQAIRLDDLDLAPAFVKIDVEGFELQVLKGLEGTLRAHRPIVLVERPDDDDVEAYLGAIGYRPFTYEHRTGRFAPDRGDDTRNVFFVAGDEPAGDGAVRVT